MIEKMKTDFSDMKETGLQLPPKAETKALSSRETVKFGMDKAQGIVIIGYRTIPIDDPDRYAFEVLASALSGSSGRLFANIRNRRGISYSLGVSQGLGIDPGYFLFYLAADREKSGPARGLLLNEINKLTSKGVSKSEIDLAKRELVTLNRSKLEANESVSFQMSLDELYGLGYDSIFRYDAKIDAVTEQDIARVVKLYFDPQSYVEVDINQEG